MTLSYAGPELAMPISQTGIYCEVNCDPCAAILTSESSILILIPYLNYLGTPTQVLLFSSYGNVTYII